MSIDLINNLDLQNLISYERAMSIFNVGGHCCLFMPSFCHHFPVSFMSLVRKIISLNSMMLFMCLIHNLDLQNLISYEGAIRILMKAVSSVSSCLLSATTLRFLLCL